MLLWITGLLLLAGPSDSSLGVGVVTPHLQVERPLYFYNAPTLVGLGPPMAPVDSLTFHEAKYFTDIDHAPPEFAPFHVKLDYQILILQATTLTQNWIEVVINQESGKTAWVRRDKVAFSTWEDFLLGVYAVEVSDPSANTFRSGPNEHAADMGASVQDLRPLAIQGNWMQVAPLLDGKVDTDARKAWIRWRDEDRLLVRYSLLS